jgi:hypothetical protein
MFWFILLLLIIGTGFYLQSSAREVEDEIKSLQEQPCATKDVKPVVESNVPPSTEPEDLVKEPAATDPLISQIIEIVENNPGMKQTELYPQVSDVSKKVLQQTLKELADGGCLKREKNGSTYLLFPQD